MLSQENRCNGPCLKHCYTCDSKTVILAHISMVYIIASILYLISTRCIGTPFKDSLSEEQLNIKKKSANQRSLIFVTSLTIGFVCLALIRPFKENK